MIERFANMLGRVPQLTFQRIITVASSFICDAPEVPEEFREPDQAGRYFWRDRSDRGARPIEDDAGVLCYLVAYAGWHISKLNILLSNLIPHLRHLSGRHVNIVDWGCGQALGTIYLIDFLERNGIEVKVDNVILIEPSTVTIEYARLYAELRFRDERYGGTRVRCVNKLFDGLSREDLAMEGDAAVFHIYSNILDVGGLNMKRLSSWLRVFRQRDNYVLSSDPFFHTVQIDTFYNYLNTPQMLFEAAESDKVNNPHGNFTYYLRAAKLLAEAADRIRNLTFYAPRQFFGMYRLDCFCGASGFGVYRAFDVYAPYEIGTSYMDDVDPVYAVLSNLISRGLPTKASPFVEREISRVYGNSAESGSHGSISFPSSLGAERREAALGILSGKAFDSADAPLVMTPIAVARIEKTIVEALIAGRLSIDQERWDVVIEEQDVPCGALAIEDFRQMFRNLTQLSEDYSDRRLPEIDLTVVSPHFADSPLHLGCRVYKSHEQVPIRDYDLVIDYSSSRKPEEEYLFSKYNVTDSECYYALFSADREVAQRYVYTTDLIGYRRLTSVDATGQYSEDRVTVDHLEYFLNILFRKSSFRDGQLPILNRALRNRSVIGLLPTGGGKSLTYQLAAMLQPGVTVVVDPLKSLMQDQYDGLLANGIDCCTFINSSAKEDQKRREYMIERSQCLFAFIAPERLCLYPFRKRLSAMHDSNVYFAYGVIDEVHCVSEWGQDFRNTYLHLGRNLYQHVRPKEGHVTLFGLTATASFDVLADVERELSGNGSYDLDSEVLVRCEDTNRLELQYNIMQVPIEFEHEVQGPWKRDPGTDKMVGQKPTYDKNGHLAGYPLPYDITRTARSNLRKCDSLPEVIAGLPARARELLEKESTERIVRNFFDRQSKDPVPGASDHLMTSFDDGFYKPADTYPQAAIVFCPHRHSTDVSVDMGADALRPMAPDLGTFYSMDSDEVDELNDPAANMIAFRDDRKPVMVATKAFGMGIDKPNVRYVVNVNYSDSLEAYVQEAGRAGRDRAMALATILVSDYDLVSIDSSYRSGSWVVNLLKGHWFKREDLDLILREKGAAVPEEYIRHCTPSSDLVRLSCELDSRKFDEFMHCETCLKKSGRASCDRRPALKPGENAMYQMSRKCCKCREFEGCRLRRLADDFGGWGTTQEMNAAAARHGVRLEARNYVYQSPDYNTIWNFFANSFPGRRVETAVMDELLDRIVVRTYLDNGKSDPQVTSGLLDAAIPEGVDRVFEIDYDYSHQNTDFLDAVCEPAPDYQESDYARMKRIERNINLVSGVYSKAIYRMCCIGFVDDFTIDYSRKTYRVTVRKRPDGFYYNALKNFYARYDSEDKARDRAELAKARGDGEVRNCLMELTEFVYEKVATKKKRAIDDIRSFCNVGIDRNRVQDWKETNEELKDHIYYYFNSKYARHGYTVEGVGPYSLVDDTDGGREGGDLDLVFKYIRVVEDELCGDAGNQLDNLKHLQGAVRLLLRNTDGNPVVELLNVFCILALGEFRHNESIRISLENSYASAYRSLRERFSEDMEGFYGFISRYKDSVFTHGADSGFIGLLEDLELDIEVQHYNEFVNNLHW